MVHIIELSEKILDLGDLDIEVEYQGDTIGKFGLDFDGVNFLRTTTQTDCLAKSNCGIPEVKTKVSLAGVQEVEECCEPGSGCC